MTFKQDIVFIGAGNLATQLSSALYKAGNNIIQIISRTDFSAKKLANKFSCDYSSDISKINTKANIIIICVSDNQLKKISSNLKVNDKLVIHTSGSLSINVLSSISNNYGVLYPVQTFTSHSAVSFAEVPICIESNSNINLNIIELLASSISNDVRDIDSDKRKIIHLSAVIANNFTNLNFSISEFLLKEHDIPFDILKPLIAETANKIIKNKPSAIQTGPAYREDYEIITKHLDLLIKYPAYKKIYEVMSDTIIKNKRK